MEKALETAAELLEKKGFEAWEAFGLEKRSCLARSGPDGTERLQTAAESGIGLRASLRGRPAYASTNLLTKKGLLACVGRLEDSVETATKDPDFRLPAPRRGKPLDDALDPEVEALGPLDRRTMARETAIAARSRPPAGAWRCEALYRDSVGRIAVRNSLGLEAAFRFSRASLHCECAPPKTGTSSGAAGALYGLGPSDLDPAALGRDVSRRAGDRAGSVPLEPGSRPALFSPLACAHLTSLLAPLLSGELAASKLSAWSGLLGEAVGSAAATLWDDPGIPRGYGSTPYDGEGVKTGRILLVDKGILKCFAQTAESAARAGAKGTASAVRHDFASPPELGFHNLHVAGSSKRPEGLCMEVRDGVYLEEVWELKDPGARAGEITLGGWGYRILRGEKAFPVTGFMFQESLPRLLFKLAAACDDLVTFPGGVGGVTCLFEGIRFQATA